MSEHEEGGRALKALIAKDPQNVDALYCLGYIYSDRKEWALAGENYEAVLKVEPEHHAAAYQLGRALESSGRGSEALAYYRIAVRTKPRAGATFGWMWFPSETDQAIRRLS